MTDDILSYAVEARPQVDCIDAIFNWVASGRTGRRYVACLNPHSYVVASRDPAFSNALRQADWLIPDGIGVVHASRILGGHIRERVTGADIFFGLHERMNRQGGMSVFFLGASETTLANIRQRMARDYPNIRVAGTYSPPFKPTYTDDELATMIREVNAVRPDVLWVGMTAPKHEKWIASTLPHLDVKFAGAIGAVFDFYAGNVKRSHPIFQRLGLEWLPRLIQEPRRLWRRTFISGPIFVLQVLKERLFKSDK